MGASPFTRGWPITAALLISPRILASTLLHCQGAATCRKVSRIFDKLGANQVNINRICTLRQLISKRISLVPVVCALGYI